MQDSLRDKASKLPMMPGGYMMLDKSGSVIYIGKAKQLKNRGSSYFVGAHDLKTETMISKIADFDVIIANNEFEALVLENSLIKHHMPKYNIMLKDDKGYPFIRVDIGSEYPTFSIVSKVEEDGARYFGPYGGRSVTRAAVDSVCKALKLPTCGKKFPRDIGRERPCLNYHMGTCRAYCLGDAPAEEYQDAIDEAVMILEGKTAQLKSRLQAEMEEAAGRYQFELAAEKRDRLKAVALLETKQRVVSGALAETDVIGFFRGQARSCLWCFITSGTAP
jgi:excinuclease ABC subunit C